MTDVVEIGNDEGLVVLRCIRQGEGASVLFEPAIRDCVVPPVSCDIFPILPSGAVATAGLTREVVTSESSITEIVGIAPWRYCLELIQEDGAVVLRKCVDLRSSRATTITMSDGEQHLER